MLWTAVCWIVQRQQICQRGQFELSWLHRYDPMTMATTAKIIITTQQKRQYSRRRRNPLSPASVYIASTAKEEKMLSRKDQVSISRLRSGHYQDLKYWLHKIGTALNTACRKCGMGEESVEHVMGVFSNPPPCSPTIRTLPDCVQPPQGLSVVGAVEG